MPKESFAHLLERITEDIYLTADQELTNNNISDTEKCYLLGMYYVAKEINKIARNPTQEYTIQLPKNAESAKEDYYEVSTDTLLDRLSNLSKKDLKRLKEVYTILKYFDTFGDDDNNEEES